MKPEREEARPVTRGGLTHPQKYLMARTRIRTRVSSICGDLSHIGRDGAPKYGADTRSGVMFPDGRERDVSRITAAVKLRATASPLLKTVTIMWTRRRALRTDSETGAFLQSPHTTSRRLREADRSARNTSDI